MIASDKGRTANGRFGPVLRWLGLTMVVVLLLQMAAVLTGVDWSDETRRPQVIGPLVAIAPMGFMGLLVALIGSRLDLPEQRFTPLRWIVCLLSAVLAIGMVAAVPLSLTSDGSEGPAAQRIEQGRKALAEARTIREDDKQVQAVGEQLAQAGQLAADATAEDKKRAAEQMIDMQIAQMDEQLKTLETQQSRASNQRLIGGTGSAVVLAIAFVLLALCAVL